MTQLLSKVVFVASSIFAAATASAADPSRADVIGYASKAFANKLVTCGSKTYILTLHDTLNELHEFSYKVTPDDIGTADRLNGIDFRGKVTIAAKAYRRFNAASAEWEEWQDAHSTFTVVGALMDIVPNRSQQPPMIPALIGVAVLHKKGVWSTEFSTVENVSKLDCPTAASIQTQPPQPKEQTGSAEPQSFVPNAVLNRAYPWSSNCFPPRGTRIMDLGRDKVLTEYESVLIDPAVCAPGPGVNKRGPVPPDAIDRDMTSIPAPASGAGITSMQSAVSSTTPSVPAVDPSRATSSHSPTRTFFPTNAVTVYVHGYGGAVLCVVPAGTPVPARMEDRQIPRRSDFGVVAYRADLCPNAPSPQPQPRDMYHEFFFRAMGPR